MIPQPRTTLVPARAQHGPIRPPLPVLIRVPALRRSTLRGNLSRQTPRRRRLRREVRLAGAAVLLVAPVGLAFSSFQTTVTAEPGGVPARLTGVEGFTGAEEGIAPVLPMAPGLRVPVPACEADAPVVLPGYVLPDDGTEEPAHAGG